MASRDNPGPGRSRTALFGAGMLGVLIAVSLSLTPAGETLDWQGRDLLLRFRGPRSTKAKLAIIAIADSTLAAWPEPMLFWGPRYAGVIEQARKAGVNWIGLDVIPNASVDDWLSQRFTSAAENPAELPDRRFLEALRGGRVALSYSNELKPAPQLMSLPATEGNLGFTDATFPEEAVVRRIRLSRNTDSGRELSLVAVLAQRALGIGPEDGAAVPVSDKVWINYLGPPGSVFTLPAERVASGALNADEHEALRGAIVLFGPTFRGSNDDHQGPSGRWYPGVEIQAHALATLIDGRPLKVGRPLAGAMAATVVGALLSLLGTFLGLRFSAQVGLVGAVIWSAGAWNGIQNDVLVPLVGPISALALTPLAQTVWLARVESRQRRRVEALFGEHVSKTVAKRLLEGPPVPADGERKSITVLFADIRGFTALSEKAPPEDVVRLLNETLTALSDCVLAAEGTLDKYVGDCVMAFWNAPSDQPDHAARAIRAALAMQKALEELNVRLEAQKLPAISVRVGINTGDAVIGSIGSPALRDYTVIGNTVNLASRLESANKELGTSILVGEATYFAAGVSVQAREHSLAIRGVESAVIAYSLSEKGGCEVSLDGVRVGTRNE